MLIVLTIHVNLSLMRYFSCFCYYYSPVLRLVEYGFSTFVCNNKDSEISIADYWIVHYQIQYLASYFWTSFVPTQSVAFSHFCNIIQ